MKHRMAFLVSLLLLLSALFGGCAGGASHETSTTAPVQQALTVKMLDVGQGDGFLLECKGKVMSVDCGSSSNEHFGERVLEPFLLSKAVLTIDTALITHCDRDHLSGIEYLLSKSTQIRIRELVLPAPAEEDPRYGILKRLAVRRGCRIRYLKNGDMLAFPSSLRCCYPENNEPIEEANSHSIGMLLAYGNFRMLFTGDMPMAAEESMLTALKKEGVNPLVFYSFVVPSIKRWIELIKPISNSPTTP